MILRWEDESARARAHGIIAARTIGGMKKIAEGVHWSVLAAADTTYTRQNQDIILGWLYDRDPTDTSSGQDQGTPSDRAQRLIRRTWGAYIAIFVSGEHLCVMTDPSGAVPAWRIDSDGLTVIANDISPALARTAGLLARINRSAVTASLVDPASATHLACISGISPLIPGVLYGPGRAKQALWRPDCYTIRHVDNPTSELRRVVDDTASALIEPATLFQLSGGLDSSILLTSLASRGVRPLAMNFATRDAGGDERDYARLVSSHAGVKLVEVSDGGFPNYRRLTAARQGAAPHVFGLDDAFEGSVDRLVAEHEATSVMTGQGGDAVFFQPATTLVSVDHAQAKGMGLPFWRGLPDAARRTSSSVWPHLLAVMRDHVRPTRVPTSMLNATMLTADALVGVADVDRRHPWSCDIDHLPPGKRMQIVMIANSQIFHRNRATGTASLRHPLLTQPVLESVLGIPTFVLAQGANDRGLARKVFADRLPSALVARRTKGDASDHYSRAALANLEFLRAFLLDGHLVAMGILQRDALEAVLTREALFFSPDYRGLAMQVSCEAWARAWAR